MHIAQCALDNSTQYHPAFEPSESGFATPANAIGLAFGCASSWTNGCAGHHYHSWNDPTLQAHSFDSRVNARTAIHSPAANTAPTRARSPLRLVRNFAHRLFGRRTTA
ncbi:hypothetical protein OVY01_18290 [Robbsia sp. Bb-Pol-6]|uniref:Uncharacterized protein n=1 Tax=Robbsia betulipollinis TaxID=2981849 RepID=A0ABT3ZTB1_9BURK|nr:hypothetical protein [Robbsia betulipollinis]MCY0389103.1 hypothetical protein [Robbsia betulipollinis]